MNFRERWLFKATQITEKGLDYICYNDETYNWAVDVIRNSKCKKPNRIINKLRDYRKTIKL